MAHGLELSHLAPAVREQGIISTLRGLDSGLLLAAPGKLKQIDSQPSPLLIKTAQVLCILITTSTHQKLSGHVVLFLCQPVLRHLPRHHHPVPLVHDLESNWTLLLCAMTP